MAFDTSIPPDTEIDVQVRIPSWDGYPVDLPRPEGPFRLASPDSLVAIQRQAFVTLAEIRLRASQSEPLFFFLHPLWLGGVPEPANALIVTRSQHASLSTFWSRQAARIAAPST